MATPTSIGLPKLQIAFEAAAQATANRAKKGYAAVIVRDAEAQGLHKLSSATLIPAALGAANQALVQQAFLGSDRGEPSLVYLLVIAPGTSDTTALEAGLKLLEGRCRWTTWRPRRTSPMTSWRSLTSGPRPSGPCTAP